MISIPELNLEDYLYDLPEEKIAKFPLEDRSSSKLLHVRRDNSSIKDSHFNKLPELLDENFVLVFNETKVISARLILQKETGGRAEIMLLRPLEPSNDPQIVMASRKSCRWECLIGGKKIKESSVLLNNEQIPLKCIVIEKDANKAVVEIRWDEDISFSQVLQELGKIPLPPYLKRETTEEDKTTYQTVYANIEGSVAAPTAGLHFTDEVLNELKSKNIEDLKFILHVGAGTFLPISSEDVKDHKMHSEQVIIEKDKLIQLKYYLERDKDICAVGTTSIRTLETIIVFGEVLLNESRSEFYLDQWDAYKYENVNPIDSISSVLEFMDQNNLEKLIGDTKLLIIPGYRFRIVKAIITNFHQPESTLILLIAAFLGKDLWRAAYEHALNNQYRFLSYGDSSLLI